LGPGLITGAADDDPSGIGTYSIAGAQFGYTCLWTAWFLFPLMAAIQLICGRLGMVSGRGLGGLLRKHYGPRALWPACLLLMVANVVNIGADLGAMAASTAMMVDIPAWYLIPVYATLMIALMVWTAYHLIARIFKWMTLVLFAYVISAFLAHPDWRSVMGNKLFAVPWNALKVDEDEKCIILNVDKRTIENAPGFDKDNWPDMSDTTWGSELFTYYQVRPYWEGTGKTLGGGGL
jgi:Mn2+/Fe2+ NRAMP family transporter